jgi:hypothetical protein
MKSRMLFVCFLAGIMVSGCDKKQQQTPPAGTSGTASNAATTGNPITAPMDYLGALGKAEELAIKQTDLASVRQAVQQFNAGEGHYPKDINEMVNEHYLGRIPQLPPGFELQYNSTNGDVKVVKKQK